MLDKSQTLPGWTGVTQDVLASLLSTIRLSGSLQFSMAAAGEWEADAGPFLQELARNAGAAMPFHVVAQGECWVKVDGKATAVEAGDILALPLASLHQVGRGRLCRPVQPVHDLLDFRPLRAALPKLIHIKTQDMSGASWLRAMIQQMVEEIDNPGAGGVSMLPRLTEVMFIEILRSHIVSSEPRMTGWLAALSDASMSRCLSLVHSEPRRDWSLEELSQAAQTSRTALAERFQTLLGTSPMKYLRDWRLHLASVALANTHDPIARIGYESGYGTEAAFTRAFKRAFGHLPAAWRRMKAAG